MSRLNLFSHLDSKAVEALADKSVVDRWPKGAVLVGPGDEGDRFLVMLEGKAEVSIDAVPVNELLPGDQFGEIALLHGVREVRMSWHQVRSSLSVSGARTFYHRCALRSCRAEFSLDDEPDIHFVNKKRYEAIRSYRLLRSHCAAREMECKNRLMSDSLSAIIGGSGVSGRASFRRSGLRRLRTLLLRRQE